MLKPDFTGVILKSGHIPVLNRGKFDGALFKLLKSNPKVSQNINVVNHAHNSMEDWTIDRKISARKQHLFCM